MSLHFFLQCILISLVVNYLTLMYRNINIISAINNQELFSTQNSSDSFLCRTCQNPNTKDTALLILAKSSAANPEYILHNSIPIFTFMGTHFLKIDAKHSFDVACQAIDVIIPHIQTVCLVSA